MAAKNSQEEMSSINEEDVSLQVHAILSEKNKASVTEGHDDSSNSSTDCNGLAYKDQNENASENHGRGSDDVENGENVPAARSQFLENCNKITEADWKELKKLPSVEACLVYDNESDVKTAILKLVKEKGYFPADTEATAIMKYILD